MTDTEIIDILFSSQGDNIYVTNKVLGLELKKVVGKIFMCTFPENEVIFWSKENRTCSDAVAWIRENKPYVFTKVFDTLSGMDVRSDSVSPHRSDR